MNNENDIERVESHLAEEFLGNIVRQIECDDNIDEEICEAIRDKWEDME